MAGRSDLSRQTIEHAGGQIRRRHALDRAFVIFQPDLAGAIDPHVGDPWRIQKRPQDLQIGAEIDPVHAQRFSATPVKSRSRATNT